MIRGVAIYIEGGGHSTATKAKLRQGFSEFFKELSSSARRKRLKWDIVLCGGRKSTYDAFVDAMKKDLDFFNLLLVDSEEFVNIATSPWDFLGNRQQDQLLKPSSAEDLHCQLMVFCMEAWFLADPAAIKRHFGGNCDEKKLPSPNLAESRTKADIDRAFRQATVNCAAREYSKIRDGAALLKKIDVNSVRMHCQWCNRMFRTLEDVLQRL